MKNCVFCGGGTSKEHIFARWLIRDCDLERQEPLIGFGWGSEGSFETVTEKQALSKFLLTAVCRKCNNGWMSALENKAKKALSPLLRTKWPDTDKSELLALRPACRDLTLWLLKTAVTFGEKMSVIVPDSVKHGLAKGRIPAGVCVDLAHADLAALYVTMSREWNVAIDDDVATRRHEESFRLTLQVRHLVLRVSYFPFTERMQLKPRYPVVLYPRFRIPEYIEERLESGLTAVRKAYSYPHVKVFEDETTYRATPERDPVGDIGRVSILRPW